MYEVNRLSIRTVSDIYKLEQEWRMLENGSEMTIFQSFNWNQLLIREVFSKPFAKFRFNIYIYILSSEDGPKALFPVIVKKISFTHTIGGDRGIYILGNGSYSDYLNMVYGNDIDFVGFTTILDKVKEDFPDLRLFLNDIRQNTRFVSYLMSITDNYSNNVAVQVNKRESLEGYRMCLTKSVRQNLRTSSNRMKRDGLLYEMHVLGKTKDKALLDSLVNIHATRFIEKNSPKGLIDKLKLMYLNFNEKRHSIITDSMSMMDESIIVVIMLNGNVAGYLYGLIDNNSIRIMHNCVNLDYKFYSPMFRGAYDFVVRMLYEQSGTDIIDFTRGDEQYKYNLGGEEIQLFRFVV